MPPAKAVGHTCLWWGRGGVTQFLADMFAPPPRAPGLSHHTHHTPHHHDPHVNVACLAYLQEEVSHCAAGVRWLTHLHQEARAAGEARQFSRPSPPTSHTKHKGTHTHMHMHTCRPTSRCAPTTHTYVVSSRQRSISAGNSRRSSRRGLSWRL